MDFMGRVDAMKSALTTTDKLKLMKALEQRNAARIAAHIQAVKGERHDA